MIWKLGSPLCLTSWNRPPALKKEPERLVSEPKQGRSGQTSFLQSLSSLFVYLATALCFSNGETFPAGCFGSDWIFWLMIYWWWAALVESVQLLRGALWWRWHFKKRRIMDLLHFHTVYSTSIILSYVPTPSLPLSFCYLSPSIHLHFRFAQSWHTSCWFLFLCCCVSSPLSFSSPPSTFLYLSGHEIAGMVTVRAVYEIAQVKSQDDSFKLQDTSMQNVVKSIIGSARSLGIKIVNEWESFKLHSTALFTTYNTSETHAMFCIL